MDIFSLPQWETFESTAEWSFDDLLKHVRVKGRSGTKYPVWAGQETVRAVGHLASKTQVEASERQSLDNGAKSALAERVLEIRNSKSWKQNLKWLNWFQ